MKIIESYLFIVVVLNLGLGINPSFAQFKDYKAKTKFNTSASPGDSSNTVTVPPKGNAAQTDPDRDIFGHAPEYKNHRQLLKTQSM